MLLGDCSVSTATSYFSQLCFLFCSSLLAFLMDFFLDRFVLLSISLQQPNAIQKDTVSFVWLYMSHWLNLLPLWLLHLQFLLSHSLLSCPKASAFLPPLFQPLGHVAFLAAYFILCRQTADRRLPQLAAPRGLPFVMASENPAPFDVSEGRGRSFMQIPLNILASLLPPIIATYHVADTGWKRFPFMLSLGCAKTLEGSTYAAAAYGNSKVSLQIWDITPVR